MAGFLYPLGELVIEGIETGMASNMAHEIYDQFAPKIKEGAINLATDFVGKQIGTFVKENPSGFIKDTLEKTYKYAKPQRDNAFYYTHRDKSHNNHRHKRTGYRRTR